MKTRKYAVITGLPFVKEPLETLSNWTLSRVKVRSKKYLFAGAGRVGDLLQPIKSNTQT